MPEKFCIVGDCIWTKGDGFCDVLAQAAVPLDEKWPFVVLYLRGIKDIKCLSEIQKTQMQDILLAVLRAKDYSQTHYDEVQESILSVITLPYQEKLDQILRETSELAKDMRSLFGKHTQDISSIVQGTETSLSKGKDPAFLLSEIRDALKDVVIKMKQDTNALVDLSHKDSLTGLANRRYFDTFLDECVERWKTKQENVSLIMFDIDHFKNFNDTYGHLVGDQVLRTLAVQVQDIITPLQNSNSFSAILAARYGGEEFGVLLCGRSGKKVIQVAEQLRKSIQKTSLRLLDDDGQVLKKGLHVTISVGIADIWPKWEGAYQRNLVSCADKALYHAKNSGRNCTVRYTPEAPESYALIPPE